MKNILLAVVILVVLLTGFFAITPTTKSASAQMPVSAGRLSIETEPNIRMWSGAIQFSDGNYGDFKPHIQSSASQTVSEECMTDEQVVPRRQGGCIQS